MKQPSATARFLPALEGLRGVSAGGILLTHAAFNTGMDPDSLIGRIFTRFDFFVALFFGLSGFLLWRRYALTTTGSWAHYGRARAARLLPAYLFLITAVILFHPPAFAASPTVIAANYVFASIYIPNGFLPGLTHLWSLAVEVAFYAVLPLLAVALMTLTRRRRIMVVAVTAVLALGWGFLPAAAQFVDGTVNFQILPPAFIPWFAIGILFAEYEPQPPKILHTIAQHRVLCWVTAAACLVVAALPGISPAGLIHPTPLQFFGKILLGSGFAAFLLIPYVFNQQHSVLDTEPLQWAGRISYGFFLYHVVVLEWVLMLTGIGFFHGQMLLVSVITAVVTAAVSYVSLVLLEDPARRLLGGTTSQKTHAKATTAVKRTKSLSGA